MTLSTFRRAVAPDMPAIVALLAGDELGRTREEPGPLPSPRYAAAFAAIDADPHQLLAVADIGGEAVGCLQLSFIPGLARTGMWRGQIEGVRVSHGQRGAGIGRKVFA